MVGMPVIESLQLVGDGVVQSSRDRLFSIFSSIDPAMILLSEPLSMERPGITANWGSSMIAQPGQAT